ncbi:Lar family restriction alleviation protein [Falsirhodobacter sp. 20TX0035]|uniref:Lar family restriction alleviation protein n=1 Tax=Falsirhodobacter sp. 20TX0035 TaxID=3022019 RepID=UPI00232B4A0F|nr:Lar family restriction alleviation protein [Falsirhodobacter sp. 20TX0035]MDB6454749.1 Lar family restriction alleviation protein [Falsirhodobacter sp. 20TX0035]
MTHTTQAGLRAQIVAVKEGSIRATANMDDTPWSIAEMIGLLQDWHAVDPKRTIEVRLSPLAARGITNLDEVEVGKPVVLRLWDNGAGACYFEPFTPPAPQETAPAAEPVDGEMLPCPFCGGPPDRLTLDEDDGKHNAGGDVIYCKRCGASSHVEFGFKENLVDRWNTRTSPPPSAAPTDSEEGPCVEDDGCPTEMAVLKRFWRKYHPLFKDAAPTDNTALVEAAYSEVMRRQKDMQQRVPVQMTEREIGRREGRQEAYRDCLAIFRTVFGLRIGDNAALASRPAAPKADTDVAADIIDRIPKLSDDDLAEAFRHSSPDAPLADRLRHPPSPYQPSRLRLEAADALDAAHRDLETLLVQLDAHQANTGEYLEGEDWAVVEQIRAALTDPANNRSAGERDDE